MHRPGDRRGLQLLGAALLGILALQIGGWVWQRVLSSRLEALDLATADFVRSAEHIYALMRWGGAAQMIALVAGFCVASLGLWRLGGRAAGVAAGAAWVAIAALVTQCLALAVGPEALSPDRWRVLWSACTVVEQLAIVVAFAATLSALHACAARSGQRLAPGWSLGAAALAVLHTILPLAMALAPEATAALIDDAAGRLWMGASLATSVGAYALLCWQVRAALRAVGGDGEDVPSAALGHGPQWASAASGLRLVAAAITARVLFGIVSVSLISLALMSQSVFLLETSLFALPLGGALAAAVSAAGALRIGRLPEPADLRWMARAAALCFAVVTAGEIYGAIAIGRLVTRGVEPPGDLLVGIDTALQVAALLGFLLAAGAAARLGDRLGEAGLARRALWLLAPLALVFGAAALLRVGLFDRISTPFATSSRLLLGFAALATASMALAVALAGLLRQSASGIDDRLAGGAVPEARATITEPSG